MVLRLKLAKKEGIRGVFTGTFERFGTKLGYRGGAESTVLLKQIRDESGKIVSDHLWFNFTKGFASLGPMKVGDLVQFHARVKPYIKGYEFKQIDFKLSHPTKFKRLQ